MEYENSEKYWNDYKEFLKLIEEFVSKIYIHNNNLIDLYKSPNFLIENWKETVQSGEDYHFTIFEWDDEISVRGTIENILQNDDIMKLDYFYNNFKRQVENIDKHFMQITIDGVERTGPINWWEKRILRGGQDEYQNYIMAFYKIDLDTYRSE